MGRYYLAIAGALIFAIGLLQDSDKAVTPKFVIGSIPVGGILCTPTAQSGAVSLKSEGDYVVVRSASGTTPICVLRRP